MGLSGYRHTFGSPHGCIVCIVVVRKPRPLYNFRLIKRHTE